MHQAGCGELDNAEGLGHFQTTLRRDPCFIIPGQWGHEHRAPGSSGSSGATLFNSVMFPTELESCGPGMRPSLSYFSVLHVSFPFDLLGKQTVLNACPSPEQTGYSAVNWRCQLY